MKVTNKLGLPAPLVKAVSMTRHESESAPNVIRVSELIAPPQLRALLRKHEEELSEDASDLIWSLLGTLLHDKLERSAVGIEGCTTEEELTLEVSGWKIVGHYDLAELILEGEELTDWKLTSVYSLQEKEPVKPEWEAQTNIYAEMKRHAGHVVSKAQIVAIGRDWSKRRAMYEKDYPQKQVLIKPVRLWGTEEVYEFLKTRVALHEQARTLGTWPDCGPDERWAKPDLWAVMKKGNKRATKLLTTRTDAERWIENILGNKGYFVEPRPGESTRCLHYCPVLKFCKQGQQLTAKANPETLSDTLEQSIQVARQPKGLMP